MSSEQAAKSQRSPDLKEASEVSARRSRHATGSALTLPAHRANLGSLEDIHGALVIFGTAIDGESGFQLQPFSQSY
jgi:hypothetical protein